MLAKDLLSRARPGGGPENEKAVADVAPAGERNRTHVAAVHPGLVETALGVVALTWLGLLGDRGDGSGDGGGVR